MTEKKPKEERNLYQRLLDITEEAGVAKSGKADPKVGGYAFHKIDDIEAHIKHLLCKHRVLAIPTVTDRVELVAVKTKSGENQRVAMRIELELINPDNPEERFTKSAWGEGEDRSDKMSGNAQSYALKNCYLAVFHLKGKPDNEATDTNEPTEAAEPVGAISDAQARRLWAMAKKNGWGGEDVSKVCKDEFGYGPREIPKGKTYDQIVEFFSTTTPEEHFGVDSEDPFGDLAEDAS